MPPSEVSWSTKRVRSWPAWSGDKDELLQVGRAFDTVVHKLRDAVVKEVDQAGADDGPSYELDRGREAAGRIAAVATVTEGSDKMSGPVEQVLERFDRRSADSIEFSLEIERAYLRDQPSLKLRFARNAFSGVYLTIEANSRDWVGQTLTTMSEEVEKGVRAWSFFRTERGRSAFAALVSAVLSIALFVAAWHHLPEGATARIWSSIAIAFSLNVIVSLSLNLNRFYNWLFPPFEVSVDGSSSGSRRLTALGLLAASIPIGIFVNLVS